MDMKMICEDVKLLEYVAGEATDAESQAVRTHLGTCTDCRERLKIMRLLEMEYSAESPRPASWTRWALPLAAAIVLAIGIPVVYQSVRTVSPSPTDLATTRAFPYFPLETRSASGPGNALKARIEAVEAYSAGDYAKAAQSFGELTPDAETRLLRGVSFYMIEEFDKARSCLEPLALESSEWSAAAAWYLANLHVRQGQFEAARVILRKLIRDNGEYSTEASELLEQMAAFEPDSSP